MYCQKEQLHLINLHHSYAKKWLQMQRNDI